MKRISREIEIARFKTKLLSQEKDKKSAHLRQLKQKHNVLADENEERSTVNGSSKIRFIFNYVLYRFEIDGELSQIEQGKRKNEGVEESFGATQGDFVTLFVSVASSQEAIVTTIVIYLSN